MIRLGLIGCGRWGANYVRAAREAGNADVTHVYRMSYMPDGDVVVVGSVEALLAAPIDAVVVAAPPDARVAICEKVFAAGRPAIIEKPLALSLAEAERISAAAKSAGTPWLVAHQHLFAPAYEQLRSELLSMADLAVGSNAGGPGPVRSYSALWDYGPHDVAMVLGLFGGASVEYARAVSPGTYELDLAAGLQFATVTLSNAAANKHRIFEVSASDGRVFQYDDSRAPGEKLWVDGWVRQVSIEPPLTRMVRAFADAVRTGQTDWRFGDFGVDVVSLLAEAEKLIEGGESHVDDQNADLRQVVG